MIIVPPGGAGDAGAESEAVARLGELVGRQVPNVITLVGAWVQGQAAWGMVDLALDAFGDALARARRAMASVPLADRPKVLEALRERLSEQPPPPPRPSHVDVYQQEVDVGHHRAADVGHHGAADVGHHGAAVRSSPPTRRRR